MKEGRERSEGGYRNEELEGRKGMRKVEGEERKVKWREGGSVCV